MAVRLSLCLDPGRPWPQVAELARQADAGGWHAVYVCDHFMPHDQAGRPADGPMMECWTVLTALAGQTSAVRLGTLALGNTYRHPAVLAKMAATLDQISGGRLVLGIGAGWQPNEHAAYGIALPPITGRVAALDEACAVLRTLLDQRRSTFRGAFYQLSDAPCDPKPAARVPLLVAGGGHGVMRVAARHADVWHAWADPDQLAGKNAVLDRLCAQAGRSPADVARACGGSAELLLASQNEFRAAGAQEFIVRDDASIPADQVLALIEGLAQPCR